MSLATSPRRRIFAPPDLLEARQSGPRTWYVLIANHKGGVGKTTSTAFIAFCLRILGYSVLVIDADPASSLYSWSVKGDDPWGAVTPVTCMAKSTLHTSLPAMAQGYDFVLIDSPPGESDQGIVQSACRIADLVIIPVGVTGIDLDRLHNVPNIVADSAYVRRDEQAPPMRILLTRVATMTIAARDTPEDLRMDERLQEIGCTLLGDPDNLEDLTTKPEIWIPLQPARYDRFAAEPDLPEDEPYMKAAREILRLLGLAA